MKALHYEFKITFHGKEYEFYIARMKKGKADQFKIKMPSAEHWKIVSLFDLIPALKRNNNLANMRAVCDEYNIDWLQYLVETYLKRVTKTTWVKYISTLPVK